MAFPGRCRNCCGNSFVHRLVFRRYRIREIGFAGGLSILYIQSDDLIERMILLMTCCFGIMVSYTIGLLFSFSPYVAPIALGLLSFGVH